MITINIPSFRPLKLQHLVLDYNGTIAIDGQLISGVAELLTALSADIQIHVITADTFGLAGAQLTGLPVTITVLPPGNQAQAKRDYVHALDHDGVIAIGNGRNDRDMLQTAAVGIAVLQKEGASAQTLASADVVCSSILDALELLHHPKRMIATLRS